ncbi:MAG: QueT transporter family protein [Clostridia bacterium]|nr:QueT transporter family protein [Clostridia bacterium]
MKKMNVTHLTKAAAIAAIYVVLTYVANIFGLSNGVIQIRISEALTILPFFTPIAVPGLFVGCLISNILTGCMPLDILFGSIATLLGGIGTRMIGSLYHKKRGIGQPVKLLRWLTPLPPIITNTLIVPFILAFVYRFQGSIPYFMLTVGIGELISCGVFGLLLQCVLHKYAPILFPEE